MKVVFLDRDGVINRFPGRNKYVTTFKQFKMQSRAAEAIRLLNDHGFRVLVISNQGCISHRLITWKKLMEITRRMRVAVGRAGGRIHGVYYCKHRTSDACECKKPKILLFKKAIRGKKVNIASTYFIGDSVEDMQAGKTLGCKTILVLSGRTKKRELPGFPVTPSRVAKNLWEAAQWVTKEKS